MYFLERFMCYLEERELNLNRSQEEVRGLFVLGIIATLLTSREFLDFMVLGYPIRTILIGLVVMWGAYAFSMVLAISSDWIGENAAKFAYMNAYVTFLTGIIGTLTTILIVGLDFLVLHAFPNISDPIETLVVATPSFIIGIAITVKAARVGRPEILPLKGTSQPQEHD